MNLDLEAILHHPLPDPPPDSVLVEPFVQGFISAATVSTIASRITGTAGDVFVRGASAFADDDLVLRCGNNPPRPHLPHEWAGMTLTVATHMTNFAVAVGGELGATLLGYTQDLLVSGAPVELGPAARRVIDIAKSDPMPARELRAALREAHLEQAGFRVSVEPAR